MPLRVKEVCLTLPREDGAVAALCSVSRQKPSQVLQGPGWEGSGSEGDSFQGGHSSFCLLREQGTVMSLTETATRGGCEDQGVKERSRGPLDSLPCSAYTNIWLPFRDDSEEAQRDGPVSRQLPSFLLPSPMPNLGRAAKFLPGCEHLHTAERRAGTRLVTHPCPGVTKLKFCLYTLKLARFEFTWTLLSQRCSTTRREAQRSLLRLFLILQQPSGEEAPTSPTLPALAEGLIHQA